jgi:NAD(P)-dependent dehydrogenase (short-subunit alcohol dehydrogenase family)
MISPMDLNNRNILVTGASSGIGRDTSVLLSELGAFIAIVGRDKERLIETKNLMSGSGHRIEVFDLRHVNDIPVWMKALSGKIGPLDGVVHCAGIESLRPLQLITSISFNDIMSVNASAALALTKAFRQKKVNRSGGSVVYISSVAGLIGQAGHAEYCASKSALIGISKSLSLELAKENIRVNCVAPGLVETEMVVKAKKTLSSKQLEAIAAYQPLGIGKPRDVSNAVAFLLADTGKWITGTTLVVDGGYTVH